jgi:hypothetical protein
MVSFMFQPFYSAKRIPCTYWVRGYVDLRSGLDAVEKNSFHLPWIEPQFFARPVCKTLLYPLNYHDSWRLFNMHEKCASFAFPETEWKHLSIRGNSTSVASVDSERFWRCCWVSGLSPSSVILNSTTVPKGIKFPERLVLCVCSLEYGKMCKVQNLALCSLAQQFGRRSNFRNVVFCVCVL